MKRRYSVLLLYPDMLADTYAQDTYYAFVTAPNPREAVAAAQHQVARKDAAVDPVDFLPLLVVAGWKLNLNPE